MMKMKPYITLMAVILLISTAGALSIDIEIKHQFIEGETVSFNYSISSDMDEQINYFVGVHCPYAPNPLLEPKTAWLRGEVLRDNYTHITSVDQSLEPQTCTAFVSIIEPYELANETIFRMVTKPSFLFDLYVCKDFDCFEKSRFFILNEDVYLKSTSGVPEPIITATLTYPNDTIQEITLPSSIKAEQVGSHTLEVTASKEGYKNVSESISFAVIERHANITDTSKCNADETCDPEENHQTCPQDCASGGVDDYCDLVEDEICDPDCNGTRDEDCRIEYEVPVEEGWNLVSFPLERLEGISAFILPLFSLLGILAWRIYI